MAALVLVAVALGVRSVRSIDRLRAEVETADETVDTARAALDSLEAAEGGQRGFLLTEQASFLGAFYAGQKKLGGALDRLRALEPQAPWLVDELTGLEQATRAEIDVLTKTIAAANRSGPSAAMPMIRSGDDERAMENVRIAIAHIIDSANAARASRSRALLDREQQTFGLLFGTAVSGILLLGIAALLLMRSRTRLLAARLAALRQTEQLQSIVDQLRDAVAVFDPSGVLRLTNTAFVRVSGLPADVCVPGASIATFAAAAGEHWSSGKILTDQAPPTSPFATEVRHNARTLEVWRSPTIDGGQMLVVADITRRTEAEAVARQAQKMESLGQLTGGVAHDFNNLLQVISANLELLAARFASLALHDGDWLLARLAGAQAGVERGARLTRHLLAFARRQPLAPEPIDVARLLHGMEDMLRRTLGTTVDIEVVTGGGLWSIRADAAQLETAILNLAVNARDAMDEAAENGTAKLTVEAANVSLDAGYAATHEEVLPGQYVMIAVSDTGTGMTQEQMARAIEPFYTTKPTGKGTGLGLSMVFGFAKQSGGHFTLYSEVGHGTTAKLYVPRSLAVPMPETDVPTVVPMANGELVLVVEDDPAVRAAAVQTLIGLGYRTEEAADARDALARLRSGEVRPDLLFSDVVLPGPDNARGLAAEAKALCPGIAVVFTSGYTENSIVHNGKLDPGITLINKPWRAQDLAHRLRAALTAAARPAAVSRRLVLLVEDNELVRITSADMIANLGHDVIEAGGGEAALRVLETRPVDLLMTDIGLPGIDGLQLMELARRLRPGIAVVLSSGRPIDQSVPDVTWLPKPYDGSALADAISRALGATVPA